MRRLEVFHADGCDTSSMRSDIRPESRLTVEVATVSAAAVESVTPSFAFHPAVSDVVILGTL